MTANQYPVTHSFMIYRDGNEVGQFIGLNLSGGNLIMTDEGRVLKVRVGAVSYKIDFVMDCGADPNGVKDCGPALLKAVNLALTKKPTPAYAAAYDFTLHVPPGVYRFATSIGVHSMTGISTFRIEGHRSASIFLLACGDTNQAVLGLSNQLSCEIDGITFASEGTTATADCAGILDINSSYLTTFSNIHIRSIVAQYYGILTEGFGSVVFRDCYSDNAACATATGGLWTVDGAKAVIFENFAAVDPGVLNGVGMGGGANRLGPHINTICVRGAVRYVGLRNILVDEACKTGILIGDGTNQIGTIEASGVYINTPVFQGGVAGLRVRKARNLIVRNLDHGTFCIVPMVKLEGVDRADLCNMKKDAGSTTYMVTADAACSWLRVADPIGFGAPGISANAAIPIKFLDQLGVITNL